MSVKPSDVGNLDDFAESDEDEANGPGAPEVRARGSQSGGLTVIYGWRLLRPKMDHVLGVLGQGWLCSPRERSSLQHLQPVQLL